VDLDKLLKFIFNEYIMTFIDWDGSGIITGTDAVRTTLASIMILLTPHGLRCIFSTSSTQDTTFFILMYDIISIFSLIIVFIFTVAILIDMLSNLSKVELYKYR
jgi:hypothetical protein